MHSSCKIILYNFIISTPKKQVFTINLMRIILVNAIMYESD